MLLTSLDPPAPFPTAQLALLALVRLAEPIALTSVLPYAWKLVRHFHAGDDGHASFYAGLLISAFALAESVTGFFWGGLSDRVGRKPVLLFGGIGTGLSLLVVGFAPNYWTAVFGRVLGGLLNGNIGVCQTMVGELITRPEHEARAFAVLPFVWSIGTIIGPAIGGYFAEPRENFPSIISSDSVYARFPYLLPNVVCASFLLAALFAGFFLIKETHPAMQPCIVSPCLETSTLETPLTAGATDHAPVDLTKQSYGTFNTVHVPEGQSDPESKNDAQPAFSSSHGTAFTRRVVVITAALGIFTYHAMTYDNLLPIFFQDTRGARAVSSQSTAETSFAGGLGLNVQQVGIIMAINGVIALFVQGVVFPLAASWLGVWKLFILVTVAHPIAYFVVPFLTLLPTGVPLHIGIYTCLAVRNFFSIMLYPLLLILIKQASPGPSYLGKINGLAASVGAACRTLACPISGSLYDLGSNIGFTPLAYWASGLVAVAGSVQVFFIRRQNEHKASVSAPIHFVGEDTLFDDKLSSLWPAYITVESVDASSDEEEGGANGDAEAQ